MIYDRSIKYHLSEFPDPDDQTGGEFMKGGNRDIPTESGATYLYHNTTLQRDVGETYPMGEDQFLTDSASGDYYYMITRNNITTNKNDAGSQFKPGIDSCTNSFDYDLWNGDMNAPQCASPAPEVNGVEGNPTYESGHGNQAGDSGLYWVASSSDVWTDTSNWSDTSGGGGGVSVPGSYDTAIFDAGGLYAKYLH